jgi:hypothetical protein
MFSYFIKIQVGQQQNASQCHKELQEALRRSSAIVYNGEIDACISMWERKWEEQTLA